MCGLVGGYQHFGGVSVHRSINSSPESGNSFETELPTTVNVRTQNHGPITRCFQEITDSLTAYELIKRHY
jgi:hypothetical protein